MNSSPIINFGPKTLAGRIGKNSFEASSLPNITKTALKITCYGATKKGIDARTKTPSLGLLFNTSKKNIKKNYTLKRANLKTDIVPIL